MNSIKTKLIAIYAVVVLIVLTVSGTVMLLNMRNLEIGRTEEQLRERARAIHNEVILQYDRDQFINAALWPILMGQSEYDVQGMIMSDIGTPIAPETFITPILRIADPALTSAIAGEEGFSVGRTGTNLAGITQQWISFAMPIESNGEAFIIYTRINTHFMDEALAQVAFTLVIMVLVSIVLTLILWFFLANTLTAPIINLTRHAKAIASGDFSREIAITSKDELGQLAYDFNHMAKELSSSLISITREKNKSEAILQNTSHGVLAYDAQGALTHANNASMELLTNVNLQLYSLYDILDFLGIDPKEAKDLKPEEIRETTYQDCDFFIQACVTAYTSSLGEVDGYVIVLQDVSRQMKLDIMRKEFVANVSHELRTPLTSIRTYTETLLDGAIEDAQTAHSFLEVIAEEANRMSLLVSDLLELSRIDSKHAALEMDVVDLLALLRLAVRQSQFLAATKNQKVEITAKPTPCFIVANSSRINQVISNILSNSVKYSPENTTIHVTLETTKNQYRVSIQDQGMGIPQESIDRIFERFYRVDKARARAMGGTGLGLAIVKEIMEEHGGNVHATSQMGKGTTMVLHFNKYQE